MKDLSIQEFCNITASNEPVPGGGSVAALCGSLAGALTEMVTNLTIGRKKYVEIDHEMREICEKTNELRLGLLEDIKKDSEAYNLVMNAYKLPKETDEEKEVRKLAIQEGLVEASKAPFEVAKKTIEIERLAAVVVEKGNKNAITDGMVAVMMARTAILGACQNVKVNLEFIDDKIFVKKYEDLVMELEKEALTLESYVLTEFAL